MKNFKTNIQNNSNDKLIQNLSKENDFLRSRNHDNQNEIIHLKEMIYQVQANNETFLVNIKEIKIIRNKRSNYEYEDIENLAENIKENGQIQAVTLTKDKVLISGHRRYKALELLKAKNNHSGEILAVTLEKTYFEIGKENFDKLQVFENEERKNLDNFQLHDLFKEYTSMGKSQREIAKIFNKSHTMVNEILAISRIKPIVRQFLEELQYYGMSKRKFLEENLSIKDIKTNTFGIVGLRKFFSADYSNQTIILVEMFKAKLTKLDLQQLEYQEPKEFIRNNIITKFTENINKKFETLTKKYNDEESKKIIEKAEKYKILLERELNKLTPKKID